jgi:nucleoside-triphosphatase
MGRIDSLSGQPLKLILLSGPREVGKTTLLVDVISRCRMKNISVAGLITPAVFQDGSKTAIDLLDLKTGDQKRMANLRKADSAGIMTERWLFDPAIMEWGNQVLSTSTPCQLLVVDELGPIEFEKGQGLQNGIRIISEGDYQAAVVVIRPELVDKARQLWPASQVVNVEIRSLIPITKVKLLGMIDQLTDGS